MSFPRYLKYKASGVEWLGDVPEHWTIAPVASRYEVQLGKMLDAAKTTGENLRPYLRVIDVQWGRINTGELAQMDFDERARARFGLLPGDLLVNEGGSYPGRSAIWDGALAECYYQKALHRLRALRDCDDTAAFLRYVMEWAAAYGVFSAGGNEATIEHLPAEKLKRYRFGFPPIAEQLSTSAFLDRETAKIDALIAEQQRLVELLKEKRQAVISHSVTKGLNPDAQMKPSGVEWLGEVPAHWEVIKMKWVAKMESGHTPDKKVPAYWEGGNIPWVSLNDATFLKDNDYISDTAYQVTELGIANSSAHLLPANAVVFSRDATIGRCAITTRPMAVSQHFIAWICGERVIPEFLLMRSRSMRFELDRLTTGATLKTIGMPEVRTLVTPVPPIGEQESIIAWVSGETARVDSLTDEAERAIALLQERRTALISAAVTGQIDVRKHEVEMHA